MFTVEKFCYERHILGVNHMTLDPLSQQEVNRCSLRKDLGFTTSQVLLDYLVGSDEALVFKDTKRDTILGICGAHQSIRNGTIVVTPWFFSNGFHKKPKHVRSFLRVAKVLLEEWEQRCGYHRTFISSCLNDDRNKRLLEYLGFMWTSGISEITFKKKGGRPYGIAVSYGSPEHGNNP
mgnify:CR=1 FL=1